MNQINRFRSTRSIRCLAAALLIAGSSGLLAQNERKVIRQGIRSYESGDFSGAEVQFRKAGDLNSTSFEAGFNTGAAMYQQEKYGETAKQLQSLIDRAEDPASIAHLWHNVGNSLLESQQYAQSIEAYKNSLRLKPGDQETKYNLAYARRKLQEQQQDQQQNQDQKKDQQDDQQQNQDQNKDQQDDQQQNQDQQQDQQGDQQQNQDQQQDQQGEQQPARPQQLSKEDAERMLKAIMQQEKDVKEKVDREKVATAKVKTEKDW